MKKIITSLIILLIGFSSLAQVNSNYTVAPAISGQNPFFDGSTNFNDANSVGKGFVFPRTDLTTWTFDITALDGINFPTAFDGMIVYNTATGNTVTGQGTVASVTPGFYYFSNPTGSTDITSGVWKVLAAAADISGIPKITANCSGTNGFRGIFKPSTNADFAGTTTFVVTLVNDTFFGGSVTPSITDVTFTGGPALTVTAVSPSVNTPIPGGGTLVITYTLGGDVPFNGVVTGTYSRLGVTASNTLDLNNAPEVPENKNLLVGCSLNIINASYFETFVSNSSSATVTNSGITTGVSFGNPEFYGKRSGQYYSISTSTLPVAQKRLIFTTPGSSSVIVPQGVTAVDTEVWGAGGNGGGITVIGYCGGGGGGAYSATTNGLASGGDTLTYVVGQSASGISAVSNSTSNTLYSRAFGGESVPTNSGASGAGGSNASGVGLIKFSGGNGAGTSGSYGAGGGGSSASTPGNGNNAVNNNGAAAISGGGAGGFGQPGANGTGGNGSFPGGGGGGARRSNGGTNPPYGGGIGGNGQVIISYQCPTN